MENRAMQKVDGHNCAMLEAHPDPEIFRIRLGKALDYEYVGLPIHTTPTFKAQELTWDDTIA